MIIAGGGIAGLTMALTCHQIGLSAKVHESAGGDGRAIAEFATAAGTHTELGAVLIGADGLRSAARAQMYPDEGEPVWGGAVLWRGPAEGPRSGPARRSCSSAPWNSGSSPPRSHHPTRARASGPTTGSPS